jgi:hypothetical protein
MATNRFNGNNMVKLVEFHPPYAGRNNTSCDEQAINDMSNTTPTTNTLPGIDSNMVIKCVVFRK